MTFISRSAGPSCKECGSIMIPEAGRYSCVNCGTAADLPAAAPPPWVPRHKYDVQPIPKTVHRETVATVALRLENDRMPADFGEAMEKMAKYPQWANRLYVRGLWGYRPESAWAAGWRAWGRTLAKRGWRR